MISPGWAIVKVRRYFSALLLSAADSDVTGQTHFCLGASCGAIRASRMLPNSPTNSSVVLSLPDIEWAILAASVAWLGVSGSAQRGSTA